MSANTSAPNRASLLAGLRTGGVRSNSNIPHTAAPTGTFSIPRITSNLQSSIFPEEDEEPGQFTHNVFANHGNRAMPMTAAVDGPNNRFMQQQQNVNQNIGSFSPAFAAQPNHVQAQALQMQMMQLEIIRMQTIQAQQYQAQLFAQSQQPSPRRASFNPPATAGPTGSFDLRSATLSAQMRRSLRPQDDEPVPMTAALGGKFGSRANPLNSGPMGRFTTDDYDDQSIPPTPNSTTVISGGTSLGGMTPTTIASASAAVSKSETASNWRRGGNNNSVLRGGNRPAAIKTSPPPTERRLSPPPAQSSAPLGKSRPQPLLFNGAAPMPAVAIDHSEGENDDGYSTSSSESAASNSPPTTPRSSSSLDISGSPSKDAAKAMPATLGLGHPSAFVVRKASSHRLASQPMRQPRGPPSGPDELGPRNFAARMMVAA
ncbi:hypothetical protein B0H15DRAFT_313615 [Mycena belliarum]|uniref:Uncharacterized protein n=1 Tax=Mycena belliarum TaxID=1033014 RepID=A0AAD6UMQ0_9AGAR|nr:hypothetical protein B0H15DRAFT_313615 [Mycena belliae]